MFKKLDLLVKQLNTCKYHSYDHLQKSPLILKTYTSDRDFFKTFKNLLKKTNGSRSLKPVNTPTSKKIVKPVKIYRGATTERVNPPISDTKRVSVEIVPKRPTYINSVFNAMANTESMYAIQVNKNSDDPYSEVFLKAIDNYLCVSSTIKNTDYYKKIKYLSVASFNKNSYYKLFNYTAKNFKKSTLDDVFANNKPVELAMLVVYANVFNCNLVYIKDGEPQFMTPYIQDIATVVLYEEGNAIFCLKTHHRNAFIRGTQLTSVLNINRIFKQAVLDAAKLPELQNLSKMKNYEYKKMGKNRKINMSKSELVIQLMRNC